MGFGGRFQIDENAVYRELRKVSFGKTTMICSYAVDLFKNQFVVFQIHTNKFKFFQNTHA